MTQMQLIDVSALHQMRKSVNAKGDFRRFMALHAMLNLVINVKVLKAVNGSVFVN